ncbi:MAG TPA: isoleucine--tRNA ligase [Chloroflexaceae bacterium]|nr:isoleucine--tRNA ligase [Chloroflexaceae bacterium]
MFQDVPARPDYLALEERALRHWAESRAFELLREQTRGGPPWSFLDGPITANNPMGVHHAWGRTYKDLYNRFRAMLGHELRWQQGFDCQGLWVEVEVEKALGFKSKREIEAYGVARFVEACKARVHRFAAVQTAQSKRLGYWMDWDNSYYTLSDENNYSIWGFLKGCHERGWLYRGHDVMPWCPRCGTALSEHEIATEGYVEAEHLALTVALPLPGRPGEALLAWTTTPWTLPANVAAAVNPTLAYARVSVAGREGSFWLARGAVERLARLVGGPVAVLEELPGAALVGWPYTTPFGDLEAQAGVAHRVVPWPEVAEDEGTGVVHLAPGAGKEDFALGKEHELPVLAPLDEDGVFGAGYGWLTGRLAGEVAEEVAEALAGAGLLVARERHRHRYPACWRCGTELVFRLVDEWLIAMDELRPQMMAAAREATWVPAFGLGRELDWLRTMDDWMISKKRYWGLALPLYPCAACGHVTVVGSREELQERAVEGWEAFEGHSPHRPWVDMVRVACERCGAPVARVPDVGNPWLDAGIVAFSTLGYRRDRAEWARWFPADLVLESFPGQFRNWFYALLAMSTALEGRAPFKHLVGYALVRDERGAEMHKSKGTAIWFENAVAWHGVEPLRWLFAGAALERNLNLGPGLVEEAARRLQPLWEVYRFFVTYARLDGWRPAPGAWRKPHAQAGEAAPLDRWLALRVEQLVATSRERLGGYDARGFTQEVEAFLDDLSNWYVRRSRRRFWGAARGAGRADKEAAYAALYGALVTLARLLAPALPFLSEELYQNLVRAVEPGAPASVHLAGYPEPAAAPSAADGALLGEMVAVRQVARLGHAARRAAGLRVRQPLARLLAVAPDAATRAALLRHEEQLRDELNVKAVELLDPGAGLAGFRVRPNLPRLGPRLGPRLPALRAALAALGPAEAEAVARGVAAGEPVELALPDGPLALAPDELLVESAPLAGYAVAAEGGAQVALDTALTDELRAEGLARDLVRAVQELRKGAGLAVAERVALWLDPPAGPAGDLVRSALSTWGPFIQGETLADALTMGPPPPGAHRGDAALDGASVALGLAPLGA